MASGPGEFVFIPQARQNPPCTPSPGSHAGACPASAATPDGRRRRIASQCSSNPERGFSSAPPSPTNEKATARVASSFIWWRRRESNPRPQALCRRFYMCSLSFDLTESPADRQALLPAIPKGFSDLASGRPHRDPVRYDARNLNAPARLQSDGTLLGFKQRVRSCRRWQL